MVSDFTACAEVIESGYGDVVDKYFPANDQPAIDKRKRTSRTEPYAGISKAEIASLLYLDEYRSVPIEVTAEPNSERFEEVIVLTGLLIVLVSCLVGIVFFGKAILAIPLSIAVLFLGTYLLAPKVGR